MRKARREEADNALDELEAADAEYEWLIREANLPEHADEDDDEGPDADFHTTAAESGDELTPQVDVWLAHVQLPWVCW